MVPVTRCVGSRESVSCFLLVAHYVGLVSTTTAVNAEEAVTPDIPHAGES